MQTDKQQRLLLTEILENPNLRKLMWAGLKHLGVHEAVSSVELADEDGRVFEVMYCPSAFLDKLSIFLLYKRIFVAPGGNAKKFITGGLYASSVMYLALYIF
jgi:hypothetical protein